MHANPRLSHYLDEIIGRGWHHEADELEKLLSYEDKAALKAKLEEIKAHNKRKLARHLKEHQGVEINTNSIFDIQIKTSSRVQTSTNERFVCDSQIS